MGGGFFVFGDFGQPFKFLEYPTLPFWIPAIAGIHLPCPDGLLWDGVGIPEGR